MPWSYDPKDAVECLPEGIYDAELAKVEEKVSKSSGRPMLELTWNVFTNGKSFPVRDYIVQPSGMFKMKQIARAWGKIAEFDAARFDLAAHVGTMAQLSLTVQSQDGYADKNQVASVKASVAPKPATVTVPAEEESDGEIPF